MRAFIPRLVALTALALAIIQPAHAQTKGQAERAVQAPTCGGRDMLAELTDAAPAAVQDAKNKASATIHGNAILWRISGKGVPPSHLFGTIHLTDERINKLSPAIEKAMLSAKTVALEIADLSPAKLASSIGNVQSLLVYTDGRSLSKVLDDSEKATAAKSLERAGMPGGALEALKPWVVTMTMALSDCERQRAATGLQALDFRIGERAKKRGIPVVGLETMEDQLRAMAAVPDTDQLTLLRASLKFYDRTDDMIETMVQRYIAREIGLVWPLQEATWRHAGFDTKALDAFQQELVTVRNLKMRDAALKLLGKGAAFIAVGALHLPGEKGVVELVRQAGYAVEPIE